MPIPTLAAAPTAPQRLTDLPSVFVANMDALLAYIAAHPAELNTWSAAVAATVSGTDFNSTSTTSLAIGTGSKTLTVQTGKLYNIGQFVIIANTPAPANYMAGQVTSYTTGNGELIVNVTVIGGSGTLAAWSVGLVPVSAQYLTLTGAETATNKTIALGSNTISGTKAQFNTALTDGDFATQAGTETLTGKTVDLASNTLTGTKAQFNTAMSDADFATLAGTETLTGKTLSAPIIDGAIQHDDFTITDAAGFSIDPLNGDVQSVTLGAARTPTKANWVNGKRIRMMITAAGFTIDWTTVAVTWGGGVAPTLGSGITTLELWQNSGTIYGAEIRVPAAALAAGINYVGGKTASGTTGAGATTPNITLTNLTGGLAAAPVADDLVVVALSVAGSSDLDLVMTTSGYTEDQDLYANSTSDTNLAVYYKKMGASPDASFDLSIPSNSGGSYAVCVQVFRSVDTTTPLDVTTTTATGTTTVLADPPATNAPTVALNLVLLVGGGAHGEGAQTFAASYLNSFISIGDNGSTRDATCGMGFLKNKLAAYNGAAWTFSGVDGASYSYVSAALVLRAA